MVTVALGLSSVFHIDLMEPASEKYSQYILFCLLVKMSNFDSFFWTLFRTTNLELRQLQNNWAFLFQAGEYCSSENLYTPYVSQVIPSLKYYFHLGGQISPRNLPSFRSDKTALSTKNYTKTCSWRPN